jgi:copper resistance protein C
MSGKSRLAGLLAVVTTAVALVATAWPASAHAQLETMNPGPGATLKDLPKEVVLGFSEDVHAPAFVRVTNPRGADVANGDVRIVDNEVTQPLGDPAGSGRYTVSFRITSADGHPVGGSVSFTVLSNAGAGGTNTPPGNGSAPSSSDDPVGIGATQLVLLLGVLLVGLAVLVFATRRALNQSVAMVEERKRVEEAKSTKSTKSPKKRGRTRQT